ncbi:MAG TPA: hypothetical protein VL500_01845 [Candidatus Eisenbacteria bacterium]|jgi:hypothetical protein|nr:hypothetical protein [Candidatus Eisenbacteria bacterium]
MTAKTAKKRDKKAIERTAYRWMMRCLRAMEAAGRAGKRSIELVIKDVSRVAAPDGFRRFKAEHRPAADEAVAMMRNGSMPLDATFVEESIPADGRRPLRHRYKLVFTARW